MATEDRAAAASSLQMAPGGRSSASSDPSKALRSERLSAAGRLAMDGHLSLDALQPPGAQDPGANTRWLVLMTAILLEATVPSLICSWGVLLVIWADSPTWAGMRANGLVWSPILFSATWSVTDPWSHTLTTVHGHPRVSSLVGAVLLTGGLLVAGLGVVIGPHSPLLPLLCGVGAGITAGVGASLLTGAARLVMSQRWAPSPRDPSNPRDPSGTGLPLATSARRFCRALGQTVAPLFSLSLANSYGPAGALLVTAGLVAHALLAPIVLRLPRQLRPRKYKRLKEEHIPKPSVEFEVHTETSDDGGSVTSEPTTPAPASQQQGQHQHQPQFHVQQHHSKQHQQQQEQQQQQRRRRSDAEQQTGVTVEAEVHCDVRGQRQAQAHVHHVYDSIQGPSSREVVSFGAIPKTSAGNINSSYNNNNHSNGDARPLDGEEPRPLFADSRVQEWNVTYSYDGDADDDIALYVKRFPVRQGRVARFCSGAGMFCQGCHADLRALVRPSFHLAVMTAVTCRLAGLGLALLLPALAVGRVGPKARLHQMAALPAVAGIGGLLFAVCAHWEATDSTRSRRNLLSAASAVAFVGFYLLSWGPSQWWLLLGALAAGYGTSGASWAQQAAVRDALGGAAMLRCQPLMSVLTGFFTLAGPVLCQMELAGCLAILAGMHGVVTALWLLQPHLAPRCW